MKRLLALLSTLLGLVGTAPSSEVPPIRDTDDHNRVYTAACDIIKPYMRFHGRPEKEVTQDAAVQLKQAIQMLDAITRYKPTNWSAFGVKGKAYQAMGDRKAACAAFKASFDIHDEDADVAREYMYECLNLGDGAEGLRAARRALELRPSDAGLHANLALALTIAAKPKEALAAIDESLRIDPQDKISQNVRKVVLQILDGTRPQPKTLTEMGK